MEQQADAFATAGMQLIAVAIGQPKHARRYCPRLAPSVTCLCNEGQVNGLYGLKQGGNAEVAGPRTSAAYVRAALRGHRPKTVPLKAGQWRWLPGEFVVDLDGTIRYAHIGQHAADHPPIAELLAVGRSLA